MKIIVFVLASMLWMYSVNYVFNHVNAWLGLGMVLAYGVFGYTLKQKNPDFFK